MCENDFDIRINLCTIVLTVTIAETPPLRRYNYFFACHTSEMDKSEFVYAEVNVLK